MDLDLGAKNRNKNRDINLIKNYSASLTDFNSLLFPANSQVKFKWSDQLLYSFIDMKNIY